MKKTRILLLIDILYAPNCMGGTERHVYQLASGLDRDRFEVFVVRFDPRDGLAAEKIRECGVDVRTIPVGRYYTPHAFRRALDLAALIRKLEIDIVQTFHFKSDTYGVLIAKLAGVPIIVSSRRDMGDLRGPAQQTLIRLTDRLVDRFLVNAEAIKDRMVDEEDVDPSLITTIYNGIDLGIFRAASGNGTSVRDTLGVPPGAFLLGYIAHFRPEKGHTVLFDAVRRLKSEIPELRLLLVGDGPRANRRRLEEAVESRGLKSNVIFLGAVGDVQRYIPSMDVMCFVPIENEGLSNAIIETMAVGRPVIATDVGGNRELVRDGSTGLLIPPDDPDAIVGAVRKIYGNTQLRESMAIASRTFVEEQLALPVMIDRYENFYSKLVTQNS
jgi:glycosyltransferase involved in cell wall biosynthesis